MKKILVPTDFSDCARNAVLYAIEFAGAIDAEIALLHVYSLNIIDPHVTPEYIHQMASDKQMAAVEALIKEKGKIIKNLTADMKQVKIKAYTDMGFISDCVLDKVDELDADLIIMGTTGAGGLRKLLGSNTYNLIAKTTVPVLAVPEKARFNDFNKIVYATDLKHREYQYIKFLLELTESFNSNIICLHIDPVEEKSYEKEKAELQEYFWKEINSGKVSFEFMRNDDPAEGINSFANKVKPDLLVLLTKKRKWIERVFHKSVIKELSSKSVLPILAIHEME